ncbi:MAG TPA: DUF429 domain-containing protein [Candidatus Acidoferrum sp.]|nr:DUF429 domain-containing protein [Candidatus Acidoferrum sp.]
MKFWAGMDGCRDGWILAVLSEVRIIHLEFSSHFKFAIDKQPLNELILVDIPIGLPSAEHPVSRDCDALARKLLTGRASTVFSVPCREAIRAKSPEGAKKLNLKVLSKSLSLQSLGIRGKIKEVDEILRLAPSLQQRIRETHPELCFRLLNKGVVLTTRKKDRAGQNERQELISRFVDNSEKEIDAFLESHPRSQGCRDDLLDACVAAIVARLVLEGKARSIPSAAQRDACGITMEIVGEIA